MANGPNKPRVMFPEEPAPTPAPVPEHKTEGPPKPRAMFAPDAGAKVEPRAPENSPAKTKPNAPRPMFAVVDAIPETPVVATGPAIAKLDGMMVRKRFDIDVPRLQALSPESSAEACERALKGLMILNLETLKHGDFLQAGLKNQESFADITSRMLGLATSPDLVAMDRGLAEMRDVVVAMDLKKLTEEDSGWHLFGGSKETFADRKKNLQSRVEELRDRGDKLRVKLPNLRVLLTGVDVLETDVTAVLLDLESDIVYVRFIIGHLRATPEKQFYTEWADQLQRRLDSLIVSRVSARQALLQLKVVRGHLSHLTETVYTALVNIVPAWCGNCATFLSSVRKADEASKGVGVLASARESILKLLGDQAP